MNFCISFLQRLIKKSNEYRKVFIEFVIDKINKLTDCSEKGKEEVLRRCREYAQKIKKSKKRNFIFMRIGQTSKKLLASIMDFKVVLKCKKRIETFFSRSNYILLLKGLKGVACVGAVIIATNVTVLSLAQEDEFSVGNVSKKVEVGALEKENIVVDEGIAQERFNEGILQDESEEEIVIEEAEVCDEYADAITESVLDNEKMETTKTKEDEDVKIVEKEISVIDVNAYNLEVKYGMTMEEVSLLQKIVEAESGGEDLKGRILVANVVLNRVKEKEFPNSVESVILQVDNGVAQFSPVSDGRLWSVSVSDITKEAVQRALDGEDYSEGALYFMEREYASTSNWFDSSLTRLFRHGCHEFFK